MGVAIQKKMVNGRVDRLKADQAAKVLEREGLTISAFIRNSLEYVAESDKVPECGMPKDARAVNGIELKAFIARIETAPMPGKLDYPGLSGDELAERLRMERYGY